MNIIHPATGERAVTIEDALCNLSVARERFDVATRAADEARKVETQAMNDLNKAQRAFDAAVGDIRSNAPWNSDWHSKNASVQREEVLP